MLKAGARVVISEYGIQGELRDSPFEDGVMWLTRKIDGETWGVPEEAVPDRMTLMLMMTRWGAYPLWREHRPQQPHDVDDYDQQDKDLGHIHDEEMNRRTNPCPWIQSH